MLPRIQVFSHPLCFLLVCNKCRDIAPIFLADGDHPQPATLPLDALFNFFSWSSNVGQNLVKTWSDTKMLGQTPGKNKLGQNLVGY